MNVSKQDLVNGLAKELKPLLQKPEWADIAKTGMHKQRPPADADWWYYRAGSILLKVHRLGPIGVSKLRTKYGGRKNRGVRPEKFYRGSGNIIRKLLQQLEKTGFLKQETIGNHKGRVLTPKAASLIAQTAKKLEKVKPKRVPKPAPAPKMPVKEEPKAEIKKEVKEIKKDNLKPAMREEKEDGKVQAKSKEEQADKEKGSD